MVTTQLCLYYLALFGFAKGLLHSRGTKEKVVNFHIFGVESTSSDKVNFTVDVCGGSDVTS